MNENNINYLYALVQEDALNHKCVQSNMKYIEEKELFSNDNRYINQSEVVSFINTKLHSSGAEKRKVIYLLEKLLPHCLHDTFTNFALSWMQQCCRWNPGTINEEIKVLCILIENSITNEDVKKQVISSIIPRFAERVLYFQDNISELTTKLKLKCLKNILDLYSSACDAYRNDFQKFVFYCLKQHSNVKQIVKQASLCFVLLCRCCSRGQQGINHKEAWSSQFRNLIDTGNKLFSIIYSSVEDSSLMSDITTEHVISGLLELNPMYEKNPTMRFYGWKTKFAVISKLLQSMLLCKYPVNKSYQPTSLFNLICRFLSINETVLKKCPQTNDILALNANLCDMHKYTFDILHAMISCAQRNLITYGTLICKLCLQALKWTQSVSNCSSSKQFQSLRCKVYIVLSSWLSVSGSSSSIEIFADELIPLAISDIECVKPTVKLVVNLKPLRKNKRKRELTSSEMSQLPDSATTTSKIVYKDVCVCSHQMLQLLLSNASVLIKWEHHKKLQHTIIPLLIEIVNTSSISYPVLYSDVECRLQLFKTLFILTIEAHWKWKTLICLTGKILDIGTKDCNIEISTFCKYALNQLEIIIHPRGPTLSLAGQIGEETSTNDDTENLLKITKALENQIDVQPTTPYVKEIVSNESSNSVPVLDNLETSTNGNPRDSIQPKHSPPLNSTTLDPADKYVNDIIPENRIQGVDNQYAHVDKSVDNATPLSEISFNSDHDVPNKKLKVIESTPTYDKDENVDVANMLNDFVDTLQ